MLAIHTTFGCQVQNVPSMKRAIMESHMPNNERIVQRNFAVVTYISYSDKNVSAMPKYTKGKD